MPNDITDVLIGLVQSIKEDIKEVKDKVDEATVNIAVVETMQKAIEQLNLDERLRKVEDELGKSKGGIGSITWLIPNVIAVMAIIISIWGGR